MNAIPFTKMSGEGNDFIIIDNRSGVLDDVNLPEFARRVCRRRRSLGADELIIIEAATGEGDFAMRTVNPDGIEVEMCGNAARCVARYAYTHGLADIRMNFDTPGGLISARLNDDQVLVQLQITSPPELKHPVSILGSEYILHATAVSGVPQAVLFWSEVEQTAAETIHRLGGLIRRLPDFPNGTNVNFIEVIDRHTIWQRTYERGVEGETLACGTGAAAASVVCAMLGLVESPVQVRVLGGALQVSFRHIDGGKFEELFLGGGARFIAEGRLEPEAWQE